jgi:DNA gyrase subunit A
MATNIPPHNLGEVITACLAHIDNPDIAIRDLMEYIPGPDFPTAGRISTTIRIPSLSDSSRKPEIPSILAS